MEIKKKEFAEDLNTLGSLLFKPCFAFCYCSSLELFQAQGRRRCAANSWVINFQTMLKGAKVSIFLLVFYWQQIFVFGIFLRKAETRTAHWLGAARRANLQWGIWKTLKLCGTCLTGHGSHSQSEIYRMITDPEGFFCQLYANTFPLVKLTPFSYSVDILQPPGCEILKYIPLQLSLSFAVQ